MIVSGRTRILLDTSTDVVVDESGQTPEQQIVNARSLLKRLAQLHPFSTSAASSAQGSIVPCTLTFRQSLSTNIAAVGGSVVDAVIEQTWVHWGEFRCRVASLESLNEFIQHNAGSSRHADPDE